MKSCEECNNYHMGTILDKKVCVNCNVKIKRLYIVMIFNHSKKSWEMTTGFYYRLEDAEAVVKSMFYNVVIASLEEKPTITIFYTTDIYAKDVKLISIDDRDEIIIEGGLFDHE